MASYWQIFISFFKIGSFTLGGGYAMIPLIQQEVVDKKGWLKESEFVEMMAIAQSAPGPIALNTAIFVGYKARGIKGVIFSSLGTILPSFIVILLIAIIFPVVAALLVWLLNLSPIYIIIAAILGGLLYGKITHKL